jgi:transcriptional regulator with XRE-family HTH domain
MLDILLQNAMRDQGLSSHKAAEQIGVSHTTILRALRGEAVDVATIIKIANFLKVRPSELLNSMSTEVSVPDQLAVLLSHSRELEDQLKDAAVRIREGQLDPDVLRDIVSYALYKLKAAGETNVSNQPERTGE